jgi:hypothetical protein
MFALATSVERYVAREKRERYKIVARVDTSAKKWRIGQPGDQTNRCGHFLLDCLSVLAHRI